MRYAIAESPHRWLILAGITITAGLIGTLLMLAFEWPHVVAAIWMWASIFITLAFLVAAFVDWKNRIEESLPPQNGV
jgi:hypothetical protein